MRADTPPFASMSPSNVEIPVTLNAPDVLFATPIVAIPLTVISVAPIPPLAPSPTPMCRVYHGTVVAIHTLFNVESPTRRFVFTSTPFLMTKFLLIAIRVHSPPLFFALIIYRIPTLTLGHSPIPPKRFLCPM